MSLHSPPWNVARVLGALRSAGLSPTPSAQIVHAPALAKIPSDRFYTDVTGPVLRGMISSHLNGRPVVLSTDNLVAIVFSGDSSVHHKVRDALARKHQVP